LEKEKKKLKKVEVSVEGAGKRRKGMSPAGKTNMNAF
jgi:hypothetical protein